MLNDRKIVRPTPRTQQLQESLSRRLTAMAASLTNKRDTGTVMAPEDISALTDSVRALVRDARILEGDSVAPMINPAIPEAFWLVTRAETEIGLARSAIRDRLEEAESDPEGRIRRRLNGIIAMVEQADNLIAGRGKTQS